MKLSVCIRKLAPEVGALAAWAIVVLTGAGTAATYLIAWTILAVILVIAFGPEYLESHREKRASTPRR